MQWASSITTSAISLSLSSARKSAVISRSGVQNTMSWAALSMPSSAASSSARDRLLLICAALAMPASSSFSAWSFISEIRGETTTVSPCSNRAGNW